MLLGVCLLPCAARAQARWVVLSDIHLNPYERSQTPSDLHSDSNWALLNSTLDQMHRVDPNPPVIVVSGDFLAHHWSNVVRASQNGASPEQAGETTMRAIAAAFDRRFPRAQFVVVLGNNDDPCGDYRSAPGSAYMARLARIWEPLVNRGGAAPDFLHDFSSYGAYAARVSGGSLRIVAIDDVYWSIVFRGCGRAAQNPARAQALLLERSLGSAQRSAIVMHIPPGIDPSSTMIAHRFLIVPFLNDEWQSAFLRELGKNRDRVAFALAGHVHRSGFRIAAGVPMLIVPSVSPIYDNNPGFLTLDVAGSTLRDFRQYEYDEESGEWSVQADFDSTFGTRAFTASSLSGAHDRIARDENVRARWESMEMNGAGDWEIRRNWRLFWCAQTELGSGYAACAGIRRRAAVLPALAGILAAAVLLGITLAVLRLARHHARS